MITKPRSTASATADGRDIPDDPSEKKRVQNRLAQRTYRLRLKQRLQDLQAKVDHLQRHPLDQATSTNGNTGELGIREPARQQLVSLPGPSVQSLTVRSQELITPSWCETSPVAFWSCSENRNIGQGYQSDKLQKAQWVDEGYSPQTASYCQNAHCSDDKGQGSSLNSPGVDQSSQKKPYDLCMTSISNGTFDYDQSVDKWVSPVTEGCRVMCCVCQAQRHEEDTDLTRDPTLDSNAKLPVMVHDSSTQRGESPMPGRLDLYEDALKLSESMLSFEFVNGRDGLLSMISPLMGFTGTSGQSCAVAPLAEMKKLVQNELPNSWTMILALASSIGPQQQDSSNTAVAIILMFLFGGNVPNEELLQMLRACI